MLSASVTSFGRAFHRRVPSGKIPRWYAKVREYGTRNWALPFLLLAGAYGPIPGCQQDHELFCTSWWCGPSRGVPLGVPSRVFSGWQWRCWFDHNPGMCSGCTCVGPSLACLRLGPHRSTQGLGGWGIHMWVSSLQLAPCVGCAGGRLKFHWPSWLWHWRSLTCGDQDECLCRDTPRYFTVSVSASVCPCIT